MAEGEGTEPGKEELAKGGQAEGADGSLEGVPVPELIHANSFVLCSQITLLVRTFLRDVGCENAYVRKWVERFSVIDNAIREGDYATTVEIFQETQGYLRRILSHPDAASALNSGKVRELETIRRLLASDLLTFAAFVLTPAEEISPASDVSPVANVIVMSAATSGAAAEAATVAASSTSRRRAPKSTAPRAAQA